MASLALAFDILARDKASAELDKVGKASKRAGDDVNKASKRMSDGYGKAGSSAGGLVGKIGDLAAAAGASALVAKTLGDAWDMAWEKSGAINKATAALGLNAQQAKAASAAASELWKKGYGEDIAGATDAVESVMSSISGMKDASTADLADVTSRASAFADVFDTDVSEAARNAGILISNGLAPDATTAFDLMTASLQQVPAALRGEVMDATQEYSQYFSQLGFDGADAMAMIGQAAATDGQFGIDKMGDAIKEFSIRAIDGSKTTSAVYDKLGLDSQDMATQIAQGGDTAQSAMQQIVDGLLGIEDPAQQSQAAIALFGTPLEDLGQDNLPTFLASLQSSTGAMGDMAGASSELTASIEASLSPTESFSRSMQSVVSDALEPFAEPAAAVAKWASENPALMQAVVIILGTLATALTVATVAVWAMNSALLANPITWIIVGIVALIASIVLLAVNWKTVWAGIKAVAQAIGNWITGPFVGFFTSAWDAIVGAVKAIPQKFTDAKNAIGSAFSGVKDKIIQPIRDAVSWINTNFIGKMNGFLGNVGITWRIPTIPGFASGTSSAPAGWAWVGERGPELINLRGGEQILNNRDSMTAVGRVTRGYADGTVSLTQVFTDPLGWAKSKIDGLLSGIGDGMWGKVLSAIMGRLPAVIADKIKSWVTSLGSVATTQSASAWTPQVMAALQMVGLPTSSAYVQAWIRQIQSESGGNPNAVQGNIGDVNNISGDLAKGLVQVIGATFRAYHWPGTSWNVFDPMANLAAGMNYAMNRYGYSGMLGVIGHGHGYANGTMSAASGWAWVGENGPELVNFRGGEQVYPTTTAAPAGGQLTARDVERAFTRAIGKAGVVMVKGPDVSLIGAGL